LVKVFLCAVTPQLFQEIIASAETINPEASLEALAVVCEVRPDTRVKQEAEAASQSGTPMAEMPG
jgi:hypothetical protein